MIYVFYLDYIPDTSEGNKHGGNVYSKRMIRLLAESGLELGLLLPKGYKAVDEEERMLFLIPNVTLIERINLHEGIELEMNSILFFPLLRGKNLFLLKCFKKKNPTLRIYLTIHGLRLLDLKPDSYDRYYKTGLYYYTYKVVCPLLYLIRSFVYKKTLKNAIQYADKLFTVSNYSLVQIISCSTPKYIKPYYCGITLDVKNEIETEKGKSFLFVSGGRIEKNFLRTLEAFIKFKNESQDETFSLFVTGLSEKNIRNLKRFKKWDQVIVDKWVTFMDYLDSEKLSALYMKCGIVLYTSKSEGFGLPALEACFSGTPLIASYGSSIPEVLDSAAYYVNPYSVESICEGMKVMACDAFRENYVNKIKVYQNIARLRIANSDFAFAEEFKEKSGE